MGSSEVIVVRYCTNYNFEVASIVFDYILRKEAVVIANYVLFKSSHVVDDFLTVTRLTS